MTAWLILATAGVLLSWLTAECVHIFVPVSRRIRAVMTAIVFSCVVGTFIVADPPISHSGIAPIPCGHGADIDTRDGLCYPAGRIPFEFQKR